MTGSLVIGATSFYGRTDAHCSASSNMAGTTTTTTTTDDLVLISSRRVDDESDLVDGPCPRHSYTLPDDMFPDHRWNGLNVKTSPPAPFFAEAREG
jgi:hypothetical protein